MRTSTKTLLIYEILLIISLLINSFLINYLSNYTMLIFLSFNIILYKLIFGIERPRNYLTKQVISEIIISILVFFIIFYLLGIFIGFTRTDNYYNLYSLKEFILPTMLFIILKEILRYSILKKETNNKVLIFITYILFLLLDLSNSIYFSSFNTPYKTFIYIAITLLPNVTKNILATYVSYKTNYTPIIIYLLVIELYQYLILIIPNPSEYIYSLIFLILPVIILLRINKILSIEEDNFQERTIDKQNPILLALSYLLVLGLGYFTSGYFKYYAIAIASGSMTPTIYKGDVVVIEQLKEDDLNKIDIGTIIAFKHNGVIVVHRVIDIEETNKVYYFSTKGDANQEKDDFIVEEHMIIGKVTITIPYIGIPTIWLNEL